jgi:hypothetical protein
MESRPALKYVKELYICVYWDSAEVVEIGAASLALYTFFSYQLRAHSF